MKQSTVQTDIEKQKQTSLEMYSKSNLLKYSKKLTTDNDYSFSNQQYQIFCSFYLSKPQYRSYNQTDQVQTISIKYIQFNDNKLAESFSKKVTKKQLINLWQFCDVMSVKQVFELIKLQNYEFQRYNDRTFYFHIIFRLKFNGKDYTKKIRIQLDRNNLNTQQKCKLYVNFKDKINNHRLEVLLTKIYELENYKLSVQQRQSVKVKEVKY